jgi:hypothetical protein
MKTILWGACLIEEGNACTKKQSNRSMWASGLRIQLQERFSAVHNVFHVTQLKKGMSVPENEVITEANVWIETDFSLIEHPLRVLDRKE